MQKLSELRLAFTIFVFTRSKIELKLLETLQIKNPNIKVILNFRRFQHITQNLSTIIPLIPNHLSTTKHVSQELTPSTVAQAAERKIGTNTIILHSQLREAILIQLGILLLHNIQSHNANTLYIPIK